MAKIIKQNWLLILVLFLALGLRFYKISSVPYALDGDEAAFGYYGYSLIKNISDEYGNKLPLYFPSIGDYKYPVYSYLTTLPVAIFGLSEFSARFISALSGTFLVLIVYLIAFELTKKKSVGYTAALLMAVSPYGIIFSRGAYESNLATSLVALGIYLLIRSLHSGNFKNIFVSLIPFGLAVFTYSSTRVFLLLFVPLVIFIIGFAGKKPKGKSLKGLILYTAILILGISTSFLDARSLVRAKDIGIFRDNSFQVVIDTEIKEDGWTWNGSNLFLTRVFHNKPLAFVFNFSRRYLEHFDPAYLFLESNKALPKYSVPNVGLFYLVEFITVLYGLTVLNKTGNRAAFIIPVWILISVVPSALTIETPNPIRTLTGLPGWIILSAIGIWYLGEYFGKMRKAFYVFAFLVFSFNLSYFYHQYLLHDVMHTPWYSDGGTKEMIRSVVENEYKYKNIVVSGDPYIFFLFYNKVNPKTFIADSEIKTESLGTWGRVERFGKILFNMPMNCPKVGRESVLYVCKGAEIPINSKLIKSVKFKDGNVAYNLIEFVPLSKAKKETLPENVFYMVETDAFYKDGLLDEFSGRFW